MNAVCRRSVVHGRVAWITAVAFAGVMHAAPAPQPGDPPGKTPEGSGSTVRLKPASIRDDRGIGGEAFSILVPDGWVVEGGVNWRPHPALPAYLAMTIRNPAGSEVLQAYPTLPFVWSPGTVSLVPVGSSYFGNEVAQPVTDPVEYIRKILLPRFRPELVDPKPVLSEELPALAEAVSSASQEPGVQKRFRAARVRIEYPAGGRTMQEDVYCVLYFTPVPQINTTFWGADRNYSFRAERGRLDDRVRLFQTMVASTKPSLEWFNRYQQLVQILVRNQMQQIRQVGELSRYIAQTSREISELSRQAYENRQASQDRIDRQFSQYIRGVDEYQNPFEGRSVELPSGYRDVWASPLGEYILSEDPNFNPNVGSTGNWQKLERQP